MNRKFNLLVLVGLIVSMAGLSGCSVVNNLRAKDSLNEGVREFNKGKFDEAQKKFERALDLSPGLTSAQLFYARAMNARFEQSLTEDLGLETIKTYEDLIQKNPDNQKIKDQALAFETKVYERLADNVPDKSKEYLQKQRETLIRRGENATDPETKAAVYHALGASYWSEAYYGHTEKYARYNRELPPEVAEEIKPMLAKGHEYIQQSLKIKPDQPDAWIFERLLLYEDKKINKDPAQLKQIDAAIATAGDNYKKYRDQQQQESGQAETPATAQ